MSITPPFQYNMPNKLLIDAQVLGPARAIANLMPRYELRTKAIEALIDATAVEMAEVYWRLSRARREVEQVRPVKRMGKVLEFRRRECVGALDA